jgi:hypothetical protein
VKIYSGVSWLSKSRETLLARDWCYCLTVGDRLICEMIATSCKEILLGSEDSNANPAPLAQFPLWKFGEIIMSEWNRLTTSPSKLTIAVVAFVSRPSKKVKTSGSKLLNGVRHVGQASALACPVRQENVQTRFSKSDKRREWTYCAGPILALATTRPVDVEGPFGLLRTNRTARDSPLEWCNYEVTQEYL